MHYSPFRRSTSSPKGAFARDLHVLTMPPAFVLSQDQTLQLIFFGPTARRRRGNLKEGDSGNPTGYVGFAVPVFTGTAKLKILVALSRGFRADPASQAAGSLLWIVPRAGPVIGPWRGSHPRDGFAVHLSSIDPTRPYHLVNSPPAKARRNSISSKTALSRQQKRIFKKFRARGQRPIRNCNYIQRRPANQPFRHHLADGANRASTPHRPAAGAATPFSPPPRCTAGWCGRRGRR